MPSMKETFLCTVSARYVTLKSCQNYTVSRYSQGTIYFMSVEVEHHAYLYSEKKEVERPVRMNLKAELRNLKNFLAAPPPTPAVGATKTSDQPPQPPGIVDSPSEQPRKESTADTPFRYNPLHDLESLHWLALYLLFGGRLVDAGDGAMKVTANHIQAQYQLSKALFCDLAFRMSVMRPGVLRSHLAGVHPRVAEIAILLDGARSHLTQAFVKSEENLEKPIPFSVAEYTYAGMLEKIGKINQLLATQDVLVAVDDASSQLLKAALAQNSALEMPQDGEDAQATKKRKTDDSDPFAISSSSSAQRPTYARPRRSGRAVSGSKDITTAPE